MALTQPGTIPQPWGSDGQVGTIPQDTTVSGKASWAIGFPPETALPLSEGGVPPSYLDFQGVLNVLSAHNFFQQSGAHYTWANSLDYPVGAFVMGSDGKLYQALQASGPGYSAGAKNPTTSAAYWSLVPLASDLTAIRTLIAQEVAKYLPLAGGAMTGELRLRNAYIYDANDNALPVIDSPLHSQVWIDDGGTIILRPLGKSENDFVVYPDGYAYMKGSPVLTSAGGDVDNLTVGGQNVVRTVNGVAADAAGNVAIIHSAGPGWVRFVYNLQICWGSTTFSAGASTAKASFGAAFATTAYAISCTQISTTTSGRTFSIYNKYTTYANLARSETSSSGSFDWIAVGRWE